MYFYNAGSEILEITRGGNVEILGLMIMVVVGTRSFFTALALFSIMSMFLIMALLGSRERSSRVLGLILTLVVIGYWALFIATSE